GQKLAEYVFASADIRERFSESKAAFESRGMEIRLRIQIGPSLPELHGIGWELLRDPKTGGKLATSERIVFSRFILSRDWRVIKPRPKTELKALIAVASPTDLAKHKLAAVNVELEQARESLAELKPESIGNDAPLTLNRLIEAIRAGIDILYLVCHGEISRAKIPYLLLQNEDGTTDKIPAKDFADRIYELTEVPRLVVLASCESAGTEDGNRSETAPIALAPKLAEAGVPAVLAMQGKIDMATVKRTMPVFFRELLKDGQIDRAMAVARGEVRERVDGWVPALFQRMKNGRIWDEPASADGKPARLFNLPFARNKFFTGRDDILTNIHDSFSNGERVQALNGLGGIGKTQAAAEFAYRYQNSYPTVLWAKAHTRESLVTDFVAIAALLDLPEQNAPDQSETVAAVKRWLASNSGWLLILDNADELEMTGEFLPPQHNGHVLLTTRASYAGDFAVRNVVNKMEPAEGAFFLLRKTGKLKADEPLESTLPNLRAQAEALSKELDGLPLALDQAAAFIGEMQSSIETYLNLYQTERATLLAHRGGLTQDHPSVTVTFTLAFKKVAEASEAAADLLRVCAFLESDAIPHEIFRDGSGELGEALSAIADKPVELIRAIAEAGRFSLLQSDPETKTISLHRLVQEVLKAEMGQEAERMWAERVVRAVDAAFPDVEFDNWETCRLLLPHAQSLAITIARYRFGFRQASRLLNQAGHYLAERAQFIEAEPLYRLAVEVSGQSFSQEDPSVGVVLSNLASLLQLTDRQSEAEQLMRQALKIAEQSFAPNHPQVGIYLNNLAALLKDMNRLPEAEPLILRALEIAEGPSDSDYHDIDLYLNTLAALLKDMDRFSEAESVRQHALEIAEERFGSNHPNVGTHLNNLAALLKAMNRLAEAEPLMRRAVAIFTASLGAEHPSTITVSNNYALLLQAMEGVD
ncbi:MAG: tetratricopeptide repeat protein, partial [Acidobacteria bacterium]|nr:tetratricopeptide repeat protein [Acidobacteriota bacterium]